MIIDVTHDPLRFHFRLIGSNLASRMGHDWTGRPLDIYPGVEFREHLQKAYEAVVSGGQPVANSRRLVLDDRHYQYDGLILPLSTDGAAIDALLVGIVPHGHPSPAPSTPAGRQPGTVPARIFPKRDANDIDEEKPAVHIVLRVDKSGIPGVTPAGPQGRAG